MSCFSTPDPKNELLDSCQTKFTTLSPKGVLGISDTHIVFQGVSKSQSFSVLIQNISSSFCLKEELTIFDCSKPEGKKSTIQSNKPYSELPPHHRPPERVLKTRKFKFSKSSEATEFHEKITLLIRQFVDSSIVGQKRKILTFINPFSGKKNSKKLWAQCSSAIESIDGIELKVIETEKQSHAKEYITDLPNQSFPDIIIIVSGDGLVHEVVNGLLSRSDARELGPKVQICHLPGGTSNGLSYSMGTNSLASAIFAISRGYSVPWDACAFTIRDSEVKYAFSSFAWAIVPDIDLGTEWMRSIGSIRITIGAISRIFAAKVYKGRIAVCDREDLTTSIKNDIENGSQKLGVQPLSEAIPATIEEAINNASQKEWNEIPYEDYLLWVASKLTIIDPAFLISPKAKGWDGKIEMIYIPSEGMTRLKAIAMFDQVALGDHLHLPYFKKNLTTSFILKPDATTKWMTADGENIGIGTLRVVILPRVLRVVAGEEIISEFRSETNSS
eukprot:c6370_g1_i1.p1 GENE.c6370_g1_i1~~c6370_g1_i1.p1  ORF type:complete len:501 (-),score=229.75 c6370_g1_i1:44-1546(-)